MNHTLSLFAILAVVAGLTVDTVAAQGQPPRVVITMVDTLVVPVQKERLLVRDEDGVTVVDTLVGPAPRDRNGNLVLLPGDVVRYILTAANEGGAAAYNVEIVDPIPVGMEYMLGSAEGKLSVITYSIDGGRTYGPAPMIEVTNENGKVEKRPAPAEMYTHVKWLIAGPIEPKRQTTAAFNVRVSER